MVVIARILGVSLITSALVAVPGFFLLLLIFQDISRATVVGQPAPDPTVLIFLHFACVLILACAGGLIGAVAGVAREIVAAQRSKSPNQIDLG